LVSGHGADGLPHVAYVALPFVEGDHADGHVLGVGVAVPYALSGRERAVLLRALLDESDPLTTLTGPWRDPLELEYRPERTEPWGLVPDRWTADRRGARIWASATPVMLDRFPKRHRDAADLVAESLVTAGYPEPYALEILPTTAVRGGVHRPRANTLPEGRHRRPFVHCRVEFATPVVGPVVAGALRYLGIGLFVPERKK
jgi:CRISPR-associated protein Csb2